MTSKYSIVYPIVAISSSIHFPFDSPLLGPKNPYVTHPYSPYVKPDRNPHSSFNMFAREL